MRHTIVRYGAALFLLTALTAALPGAGAALARDGQETARTSYEAYQNRLSGVKREADLRKSGWKVIEDQVFAMTTAAFGDVTLMPALDTATGRLALFLTEEDGRIVYHTDQLETNSQVRGVLEQPNQGIAAVSFQDLNGDGLMDVVLITSCEQAGAAAGGAYKVGDVLFQDEKGFYRDWRLSDRINRFGMNKSVRFIVSFVAEGYSTEFLYTASTLDELLDHGFSVVSEQSYWRQFERMGKLLVVPGTYRMAEYTVFLVYLVNEQGYIVWSFQPMGEYENLYALKGVTCRDIDGDGMKDIAVLARYSYEGREGESVLENDYSIYYQRTGGFEPDTEVKKQYRSGEDGTMEELVEKARAYWGWKQES